MATSHVCARASRAITVLFVDDDADTLFAYQTLAAGEGRMIVELAGDGNEAIAIANSFQPEVIVLDIGLSSREGLDGFEVARRLRASARTSAIPIVILSGYSTPRHHAAVLASGCEGHLVKPCSAADLLGLVSDLALSRREQASASDEDARASTA
jgi:CheY-like chemotaxis protein